MTSTSPQTGRHDAGEQFTLWCAWAGIFLLIGTTQVMLLLHAATLHLATLPVQFDAAHKSGAMSIVLASCGLLYATSAARSYRQQWLMDLWLGPSRSAAAPGHSHSLAALLFCAIVFGAAVLPALL